MTHSIRNLDIFAHPAQSSDHMDSISHTGHRERRRHIRNISIQELVHQHNLLVQSIASRGVIGVQEKSILLAMQQEGIESGGVFYGQIRESDTRHSVSHTEGISQYNPTLGITEVIRGNSQLRLWKLISE